MAADKNNYSSAAWGNNRHNRQSLGQTIDCYCLIQCLKNYLNASCGTNSKYELQWQRMDKKHLHFRSEYLQPSGDLFVASPSIALHSLLLKGFQQLAKNIIEQKMVIGKNRLSRKRRKKCWFSWNGGRCDAVMSTINDQSQVFIDEYLEIFVVA